MVVGNGDHGSKTVRIQMLLPTQSISRLEWLKTATEAASASEVIRNAIRVFEALVKAIRSGSKILIQEPNGSLTEIRIF